MKNHKKKSLAPLVVTAILIVYYVVYFAILASLFDGIIKYVLGIVPIVFGAIMVKVCIERIKEIQGGEEDDLSKY